MFEQSRSKREALAEVPAFAELTTAELDDIAGICDERHIEAGQELCHQEDFGLEAYVIAEGEIAIVVDGVEVARRGHGEMVGDWALFGTGHRSATLRALTSVEAVVVDPREIDSLLMAVPTAAHLLGPRALDPAC